MKQKTKQLMMTLALLLTAATGAWAAVYSGEVARESLQVGDILVKGAEVTSSPRRYLLSKGSYEKEGSLANQHLAIDLDLPVIGEDGSFTLYDVLFTPYDADNDRDGNAWKVIEITTNEQRVVLAGTTYPAPTEWDLTPDQTGKVWTLAKMPAGKVMLLADFYEVTGLAWKLDGQEVTAESDPIVGYVGFELAAPFPELYNPNSLTGITYESSDPQVATVDETTGKVTFVAASTTPVTITAHYPGNDTYEGKDVSYRLLVSAPATVTLASNDPALGTVTIYEAMQEAGLKLTADDLGKVLCLDGSVCTDVAEAVAQNKEPMAIIVDVDTRHKRATCIALRNESNGEWGDLFGYFDLSASADTWKAMFKAFGGNDFNYNGLNEVIGAAGGVLLTPGDYWLDEYEADESKANFMTLSNTQEGHNVSFYITYKTAEKLARFVYTIPLSVSNIIPTETAGVYSVLPGTRVVMEANASEDCYVGRWTEGQTTVYSPNISYDKYYDAKTHRMPANSRFLLTITGDANYTAQFAENAYDVTFIAQNKFNIKDGKATVKVGDTDQTGKLSHNPDNDSESTLGGVKKGQKVTLSAAQGYKLRKVEAKSVKAMKAVNVYMPGQQLTVIPFYFYPGETWAEALEHSENAQCGLFIHGNNTHIGYNQNTDYRLYDSENPSDPFSSQKEAHPNDPINPNGNYSFSNLY